jgi:hypothetical protein
MVLKEVRGDGRKIIGPRKPCAFPKNMNMIPVGPSSIWVHIRRCIYLDTDKSNFIVRFLEFAFVSLKFYYIFSLCMDFKLILWSVPYYRVDCFGICFR